VRSARRRCALGGVRLERQVGGAQPEAIGPSTALRRSGRFIQITVVVPVVSIRATPRWCGCLGGKERANFLQRPACILVSRASWGIANASA
jgi:hypothetical protein